jgi:peptide/nickel transport system permease protein/peptide/nickel transport system substrate-binding protein
MVLLLTATSIVAGASWASAGGEIAVGVTLAPTTFDPIAGASGGDAMSLYPIYDRLINFDPETMAPAPGLAASWEYTEPQVLTLKLREGVSFQDGTPFDAAAVKFNLERAMTMPKSVVKTDLGGIASVEAVSAHEVKINLNKPDAALVLTLADRAGMMVSPAAVEKSGESFGQNPVGTGPFSFVQYAPGDRLVVKKNPNYWQANQPSLDQITFRYFTDQQTATNALRARETDLQLNVPAADVAALKAVSGLDVVSRTSLLTEGCYFNFSREPFSNVAARQAIASAIDRQALGNLLTFGLAVPTSQVFPQGYWAADASLADPFPFDAAKAKALLAEAGHPNGLDIKGIAFQGTSEVRKAQIIQEQLKAVGVNMTLDVTDIPTAAKSFFTDKTYDMICSSWSGRPDPSQTAESLFSPKSFFNAGAYLAPGMDVALAEASSTQGPAQRAAAFGKVSAINQQYVIWLPLLSQPNNTAIYDDIKGLVPNFYGKIDVSFLSRE